NRGYHAIVLATYNDEHGADPNICHSWTDTLWQDDCLWDLRAYQAIGVTLGPGSFLYDKFAAKVSDPFPNPDYNNVTHRLLVLLQFLSANFPGRGWDAFLTQGGGINWSSIALGGHSNGTGIAAFLASANWVPRLVLFNGPDDYLGGVGLYPGNKALY